MVCVCSNVATHAVLCVRGGRVRGQHAGDAWGA